MRKFMYFVLVIVVLASQAYSKTLKAIAAPQVCANLVGTNDCIQIGQKYYLVEGRSKLNWFQAAHQCRRWKGQLLTIESEAELSALTEYLISKNYDMHDQRFWTAINDLGAEGNFYSIGTGNVAPYLKWSTWQPDNFLFNEHCVQLLMQGNSYLMNDFDCRARFLFICELYNDAKPIIDIRFST